MWRKNKEKKRKILKENSCLIRSLFAMKKKNKAVHAELTQKWEANILFTNFLALFTAYRAYVAWP